MESEEERKSVALVLSHSADARIQRLVSDLMNPMVEGSSLARLAENRGLNFHDISEEYRRLRVSEGYIRAAHRIPEVMEQTAADALNRYEDCTKCGGMGRVDGPNGVVVCTAPGCHEGKVFVRASAEDRRLMFDTFGLTNKGGGVNVNVDLSRHDQPETLHDLASSLGPLLEGERKP